ncbi:type II toxin-antitoxin system HipA family toxin [Vibrio sp. JC009]|uniref:type II toxin-antitoxin system HipA family toxin n=1 Tax=Vibrio sp. JC009 TaxID=2912314 RepID=UPI0023AF87BA|nr:type II toxin-antitoxin system HipA family toxin [Vibrio sp. JC009]WED23663.1 type II toxin-antitoxin system HipA family toxin [Vibrio sp. JC009]
MKILSVFYHGDPKEKSIYVGRLAYDDSRGYFEYDSDFLKRGLPLSPFQLHPHDQLQEAKREPFNGIQGVFNDSLPDGWGLYVMDKHLRKKGVDIDSFTPVDRLAYIGDRAMGALSYQPDEGIKLFDTQGKHIDLDGLAKESIELYTGETEEVLNHLAINGTPSGGARPKALLGINGAETIYGAYDLEPGFEHWIAKFPTGTSPEKKSEGSIEYLYSLMAKRAGIDFPETRLVSGTDDNAYFLIKRFDRLSDNQRVHMHTLAGLVNANFRVPDFTYESLFNVCKAVTKSHAEVKELFRRMLFNVITGNRDDHTKNFSFLMDEKGAWKNSPAYDITFNPGIQGEHSMLVGNSGKNVSWDDIKYLANVADIKEKEARIVADEVITSIELWRAEAKHFNAPLSLISDISQYIEKQLKRL